MEKCLACELIEGTRPLPGGRIFSSDHWVVEHCVGSLGLGTLIVKPARHCVHFWELSRAEVDEIGPLLQLASWTIKMLLSPDQVYICQWSHADWKPGHLHFVVQPAWKPVDAVGFRPGPFLQVELLEAGDLPAEADIVAFAEKARAVMQAVTRRE